MKIATWNINGIGSRLDHLLRWAAAGPDVICLQETKIEDLRFPFARIRAIGYEHIEVFGEKSYNGVAILSKLPLDDVQKGFPRDEKDAPRRLIAATVGGVRVINVYVPHGTELGSVPRRMDRPCPPRMGKAVRPRARRCGIWRFGGR